MAEAGRHLWGASSKSPAQSSIILPTIMFNQVLNISKIKTPQSLWAACASDQSPLHWKSFLSYVLVEFPASLFVPMASSPASGHHRGESGPIFFAPLYPVRYLIHTAEIPWILLFSGLNSHSSHHLSSYVRCSSPLNISMALPCTRFRYVHISCTEDPRLSALHPFGRERILLLHPCVRKISTFHLGK